MMEDMKYNGVVRRQCATLLVGGIVVSVPTILPCLFLNRNFDSGIVYTSK